MCAVGRVLLQGLPDRRGDGRRVCGGREPDRQFRRHARQQDVAAILHARQPVGAGDRKRGPPGVVEEQFNRGIRQRLDPVEERQRVERLVAQGRRCGLGLLEPLLRDGRVGFVDEQVAGHLVLEPAEQRPQDAEGGRRDAGPEAGMNALGQHVDRQRANDPASQRGRAPQLLVVPAAGIQADDEAWRSETAAERLHVVRQVDAAALLAGFDEHDAAGVRYALLLQRADGRQRREHRVAVIGSAAAVQLAVADDGFPGRKSLGPAGEFGLLVEVAIEQHRVLAVLVPAVRGRRVGGHLAQQDGGSPGQLHDLHLHALDGLAGAPVGQQPGGPVHVPVCLPVPVEAGGLVGDPDVLGESRDDRLVPQVPDEFRGNRDVNFIHINKYL